MGKWMKVMRTPNQQRIGSTCAALFEMSSEEEAQTAIAALNENVLDLGQLAPPMKVRYAANKAAKPADAAADIAANAPAAPAASRRQELRSKCQPRALQVPRRQGLR